ncbi:hypothetical protein BKA61DRAFT_583987 [Leptodontidium sp. MPI-SDFR-AT-0119]|nr:hypothetical protein BKA61DRAFT_583987 [Leptodontidium sp. MPI-SDFR-AT-0119]
MASGIQRAIPLQLLSLIAILCYGVIALPYGCQGTIEVLDVPSFGRYWACAGVELFQGFNADSFLAASTQQDAKTCANYCLETSGPDGLRTGTWNSQDNTCDCWAANYPDQPAATPGVTFIDFFAAWDGQHPPAEQNWGVFTCPEGAASGPFGSVGNWCGPLTIEPAQPALAQYGITGICYASCLQHSGFQWLLTDAEGTCNCYGDLAGVKVILNYSSPYSVADYYDFVPHPTTSTTSITKATSTSVHSASTPVKSTAKTDNGKVSIKDILENNGNIFLEDIFENFLQEFLENNNNVFLKDIFEEFLENDNNASLKDLKAIFEDNCLSFQMMAQENLELFEIRTPT